MRTNVSLKSIVWIALLAVGSYLTACKKDPPPVTPVLSVDKTTLQAKAAGENLTINITANRDWKLTFPDWITADKSTGSSGTTAVKLTIKAIATTQSRSGTIKLEAADNSITPLTITLTQGAYSYTTDWQLGAAATTTGAPTGVIRTSDGGYAIVGNKYNATIDGVETFVLKLKPDGSQDWLTPLSLNINNSSFYSASIAALPNGTIIGLGTLNYNGSYVCRFVLNADGSIKTGLTTFAGSSSAYTSSISGNAFIPTADGGFIGTGTIQGVNNHLDMAVVKLAASGVFESQSPVVIAANTSGSAIALRPEGGYVVSGWKENTSGHSAAWVIKLGDDASENLSKTFGGTTTDDNANCIIAVTNGYIIAGSLNNHLWIAGLDNNLNKVWEKTYQENAYATAIAATTDGLLVTGLTPSSTIEDVFAMKLDKEGNKVWEKTFDNTGGEPGLGAYVATTSNGFIVAGHGGSAPFSVWATALKE